MFTATTTTRDKLSAVSDGSSIEVLDIMQEKKREELCTFSGVASAITDEIFPIVDDQQDEDNLEDIGSSKQNKMQRSSSRGHSSSKQQEKKQSLFASVIQNWFLQERMNARGLQLGSEKSKKKKKKKKKNGAQAAAGVDINSSGVGSDAVDSSAVEEALDIGATFSNTTSQATATSTFGKLDSILDRFIDLQIDGSESPYEVNTVKGRDLQAFTTFLSRQFQNHLDKQQQPRQKKAENKPRKSSSTENDDMTNVLPTILMSDVNNDADKAECACRYAIRSHLNTWADKYQSIDQRIVLEAKNDSDEVYYRDQTNASHSDNDLSIPVSSNYLDVDDNPFDYGALTDDGFDVEAGNLSSELDRQQDCEKIEDAPSMLRLELRQITPPDDTRRFLQVEPVSMHNNEKDALLYPINEQSILNLVQLVIVPNGIGGGGGGKIDNGSTLDEKDIAFIKDRAESSENELVHQVFDILRIMEGAKIKFWEAREDINRRSNMAVTSSRVLRIADEELNCALKKIGQLLIRVTKHCICVGWHNERPTPISIVTRLWNEYEEVLVDLVKPFFKSRGTCIRASDRNGKIPQAFCNASILNAHLEAVSKKVDRMDRLLYFLRSEFLRRPDQTKSNFLALNVPSPMLRLCVLEAYSMRKHQISGDGTFLNEECLNELLDAKIALMHIKHHSTLRVTELEEGERMNRFRLAYKKVVDIVTKADAHLTCQSSPEVSSIASASEMYESTRFDYELEERGATETQTFLTLDCEYDDDQQKSMELEENMTRALNKSGAIWMQWVHVLCMENYSISPNKKCHINRELKTFMDGEIKNPCEGGGERKVSVILATLLYRWLEARYDEWHAELTREELLQEAMELTTPQVSASKTSKKKKSKRKKRNKDENNDSSSAAKIIESISSSIEKEDSVDAESIVEMLPTVSEDTDSSVHNPILSGLDNGDASSHVGWTTVGVNPKSEKVLHSNGDSSTARDEEIARALQEQFQEEAKQYDALNTDIPAVEGSSADTVTSIALENGAGNGKIEPATAKAGASTKTKTKKQTKSQEKKASQKTKDESSTSNKSEKSVDEIQVDHKPSRVSNNETDPATATKSNVDSKTTKTKKQPKSRNINSKQSNAGHKDDSSTNNNKNAKSEKNATKSQVEALDQKQSPALSPTPTKQSNEYQPKVGVYDEEKFVDAETYLVGRMKRVQKKLVWL